MAFFKLARSRPDKTAKRLIGMLREHLGPDYDLKTHFTPRYNPWDQRLCLVPDADMFDAIKAGKAEVVTDTIESFTETGLKLTSGRTLDADVIVTATGLKLQLLSGMAVTVDGQPVEMAKTMAYKGMMYSGVPNMASWFGYTNASRTLKADLTSEYVCRLLNYMKANGTDIAVPQREAGVQELPWFDFNSGYVQRAIDSLPRQGDRKPWRLYQNYALDMMTLRYGDIDDGTMKFAKASGALGHQEPLREAAE